MMTGRLNSENLKKWYGSKAELRRMLEEVKKGIAEATVEVREPEGRVASLLSMLFPLASGTETESYRDMHVEFLQDPTRWLWQDGRQQVRVCCARACAGAVWTLPARRRRAGKWNADTDFTAKMCAEKSFRMCRWSSRK